MTTQPTPQLPIRFLSVCSGMEAASVAWEPIGWKAVGFSEIEPFPCAILKHRFPQTPNYGSLTNYASWPLNPGSIDLLVGGTPCQSFSVAGLRKGMSDPRGNLALVFLGLADRLKPRWIVWENVPGVLSSNGGRDFGSFLGALGELGYGFAFRVLDAQYFGVPQRRRRVFVVACLGDDVAPAKVLLEPKSLCWNPASGRKKGKGSAPDAQGGAGASGPKWPADTACTLNAAFGEKQGLEDQHALGGGSLFVPAPICMSSGQANAAISEDKAHTLNATHETQTIVTPYTASSFAQYQPGVGTVRASGGDLGGGSETLLTQPMAVCATGDTTHCLTKSFHGSEDGTGRGTPIIPAVPFRKSKRASSATDSESWVEAEASNTLNNFDLGDTRTTHAVVQPQVYENHPNDSRVTGPLEVSPTVVSRFGTGGGNVPLVNNEPTAITFQPGNLRREAGSDPSTTTTTTLKASAGDQMPHVAHPVVPLDGMNLLSRLGKCGENHSMQDFNPDDPSFTLKKGGTQHGVITPMAVRRLTPRECERLQGFPDDWSMIPWKGKPADQCPDGPRYKCCGNSMAVPVMRWIGEQIARVEAEKGGQP